MKSVATKIFVLVALAFAMLSPSVCLAQAATDPPPWRDTGEHWTWGTLAETTERVALVAAIETAVAKRDFAALDAMEADYRGSDHSFSSGGSKLALYYEELTYLLGSLRRPGSGKCEIGGEAFLDQWRAASPNAPTPIIVRAGLLDDSAWCYRGGEGADTVAPESWKPFRENINAAFTLLKAHKAIASVDPEYYAKLLDLAIPQQVPRTDFEKLLDEASARFPYSYEIYFAAYRYYQPQWYGSMAEIDQFAHTVIEKTKARDGTSGYFRLYFHMALCRCFHDLDAMDWPTMKIAMADLAARFPMDWTYLRLAQLSCVEGEVDEATTYMAKVTVNDAQLWTRKDWDWCRELLGPSKAPFPQDAP